MNNRPIFSIEITQDNIHTYPQLADKGFLPATLESYKHRDDPYVKAEKDWFRENPIINGNHFFPLHKVITENDKRKYFLHTLHAPVSNDEFVSTEDEDRIAMVHEPLTLDKELNEHFAYLAHQDILQSAEPCLSSLSGFLWRAIERQVKNVITSTPTKISYTKTLPFYPPTNHRGEAIFVTDSISDESLFVKITIILEVYRNEAVVKHNLCYKFDAFNENAKQILERIFSPTYQLLGALHHSLTLPATGDLYQFIDGLSHGKAISTSELPPSGEDCPWNVVTLLANLKKLLTSLNVEKEKLSHLGLDLAQQNTRIDCVNALYEKMSASYESVIKLYFEKGIHDILIKTYDPNCERNEFEEDLKQFNALIDDFGLINGEEVSTEMVFAIVKNKMRFHTIIEKDFINIANILAIEFDEFDPLKKTLDLYQKTIVELVKQTIRTQTIENKALDIYKKRIIGFIKQTIEKKTSELESIKINSSLDNFLEEVDSYEIDQEAKSRFLMLIVDGLTKEKIEDTLLDARKQFALFKFALSQAKALHVACTEFKNELETRIRIIAEQDASVRERYFNVRNLQEAIPESPMERMIEEYNKVPPEKEVARLAQTNTEFKVLLEKYQSLTKAQEKLNSRKEDPEKAIENFAVEFAKQKSKIKKSEDTMTIKFLKIVATVLSFGLAYKRLWATKGHEFSTKIDTLFSPFKKRKLVFEQKERENTKKIKA